MIIFNLQHCPAWTIMKCQHITTNCKQLSEKNDQFLNFLYRGYLDKRLFLTSFTGANADVTIHNPDFSNNVTQLNPSL